MLFLILFRLRRSFLFIIIIIIDFLHVAGDGKYFLLRLLGILLGRFTRDVQLHSFLFDFEQQLILATSGRRPRTGSGLRSAALHLIVVNDDLMADAVLIAEELTVADQTVEPLDVLGVVRMVALFMLNQKDLPVEFDVALITWIAIATDMQTNVGHVGIPVDSTLRTVGTFVEELLIRMVLLVMGLEHLSGDKDQGAERTWILGAVRFDFDLCPFMAAGTGAGKLCLPFDTVEYGMMVAASRFADEDAGTVGAFEAIGQRQG